MCPSRGSGKTLESCYFANDVIDSGFYVLLRPFYGVLHVYPHLRRNWSIPISSTMHEADREFCLKHCYRLEMFVIMPWCNMFLCYLPVFRFHWNLGSHFPRVVLARAFSGRHTALEQWRFWGGGISADSPACGAENPNLPGDGWLVRHRVGAALHLAASAGVLS